MKYLVSFSWVITIIDFLSLEKQQGMLCIPKSIVIQVFGSSRSQMFFKIGLLKIFLQYSQESTCVGVFFNVFLKTWRSATLLKRGSNTGVNNIAKFLRTAFL